MHISTRLIRGGSQENTLLTCQGQRDRGHHVALVHGPIHGPEGSMADDVPAGIERMESSHLLRDPAPFREWRCERELRTLIRNWKPDVVHLHVAYPAGPAAVAWAKKWGVPVVLTEHWTAYHDFKSLPWWRRRVVRDVIRQANVLCPVSADLGSAMSDAVPNGKALVRVVPNVVDTSVFKIAEPELLSGVPVGATRRKMDRDGLNRILHVSSMNDGQKNVTGLLDALEGLMRNQESLRATFVGGEAADLDAFKTKVEAMGLSERIAFTGPLSTTDVVRQMQSHDVLVLNSRRENFPCVIPEAWACGLPVMSTDVGGIREHLPEGLSERGFLLDAEASSEAWHVAFQTMNSRQWDAQTIRSYATTHFSMDAVGDAYLMVYHKALERGKG